MRMILLAVLFALSVPSEAAPLVLRSGPARTHLIELYSSEGCSSCPPADDWLNGLAKSESLWKDFVPVAFHVTYWDYLGWKDMYAKPEYDARQRDEASSWGATSTYTPGLTLDGAEWRGWGGAPPAAGDKAGILTAAVSGKSVSIKFVPEAGDGTYEAYVARLGFNVASMVTAGENSGRTLRHEFVARGLTHATMKKGADGVWLASIPLPAASGPSAPAEAVAVWIDGPDGKPVQAAGGYLPLIRAR